VDYLGLVDMDCVHPRYMGCKELFVSNRIQLRMPYVPGLIEVIKILNI